jgi:vesicle transport protein SEC22
MVKSTLIARIPDGLALAASMDDDEEDMSSFKNQAKLLFKSLPSDPKCSVESGPFVFHYILGNNVCFLTICDKTYPKKLAFSYLDELEKEFFSSYDSNAINSAARPYAFVKFDSTIQKIKKSYKDTRTQKNISRLNEDLNDVTRVMTRNIHEMLGRQEQLNHMSQLSGKLAIDSKKYLKDAKYLNWQALYRKYGPPTVVIFIVLLVLYIRFY